MGCRYCRVLRVVSSLCLCARAEGSPYAVSGTVPGVSVSSAPEEPPLSPGDPALTVLQPAPGSPPPSGATPTGPTPVPHEPAALYPTMLPSFTHYVTTGKCLEVPISCAAD